jgi:hypothetical protein
MTTQICSKCQKNLPLFEFHKGTNKNSKYHACKKCRTFRTAEEAQKQKEYKAQYRIENYEATSLRFKNYYQNHKQQIQERRKTVGARFTSLKNRAKRADIKVTLTQEEFCTIIKNSCFYCGTDTFGKTSGFGIDRINSAEGYTKENSISCCGDCNFIKQDYSVDFLVERLPKILSALVSLQSGGEA